MNVLHLSTGDSKGAFYGAYRTHINLQRYGHDSTMFVVEKTSNDESVISVEHIRHKVINFFIKLIRRSLVRWNDVENKYYLFYNSTFSLNKLFKSYKKKPDLIIIYYVSGFLSDYDIYIIQKKYQCPVAFYLMDAAMFTGGCHYPWKCEGYIDGCDNCPAMKFPNLIKLPAYIFNNRKKYYQEMDCFFLSASKWLDERCNRSGIKAKLGIKKAIIGIDENIFCPRPLDSAKKHIQINIPEGRRVIFLGAQSLSDPRKGVKYVVEALNVIKKNHPEHLSKVSLLTVGNKAELQLPEDITVINIGFISDKDKYPFLYNFADGFICPSIEDAGPMMINEALMSGVPVVAFKVGVAEDLIIDGRNGFLAQEVNSNALAEAILNLLQLNDSSLEAQKKYAREYALEKCSAHTQVRDIELLISEFPNSFNGD